MAKEKNVYVCSECGQESPKWVGRCPSCGAWNTFKQNHPKFPAFCSAVSKRGLREGSILEVTYISPEGEKLTTNIKVQQSDIELLRELSGGN